MANEPKDPKKTDEEPEKTEKEHGDSLPEEGPFPKPGCMTNLPDRRTTVFLLCFLPLQVFVIPTLLGMLAAQNKLSIVDANYICYVIGMVTVFLLGWNFLKEGFRRYLCHPLGNAIFIVGSYLALNALDILVQLLMQEFMVFDNLNNDAVAEMAVSSTGKTIAMAVFMAPLAEEPLFRGGIFGALYTKSRPAAYLVSAALFSLYHIWSYALLDVGYLWYFFLYLPSGLILALAYERTDSIWTPIFLHMLVNFVAMSAI